MTFPVIQAFPISVATEKGHKTRKVKCIATFRNVEENEGKSELYLVNSIYFLLCWSLEPR